MLVTASHNLAGTVVIDITGAENGLAVIRSERLELLEVAEKLGSDVLKVQVGIDIYRCLYLVGLDMGRYVLLKAALELLHVLNLERQTGCIGVSAKILQQVLAALNGLVYIKSRY